MSGKTVTLPMEEYNELVEANKANLDKVLTLRKEIEENHEKGLYCHETVTYLYGSRMQEFEWSEPTDEIQYLQEELIYLKKQLAIERIDRAANNEDREQYLLARLNSSERYANDNFEQIMELFGMSVREFKKWRKA